MQIALLNWSQIFSRKKRQPDHQGCEVVEVIRIVNVWLFLRLSVLTDLFGFAVVRLAVEILKK